MRKPIGGGPINPMITNVFIDSCAFDPKYHPEDEASLRVFDLYENGKLVLIITHSNQKEVKHPNTPSWVKKEANNLIFSYKVALTPDEFNRKDEVLRILAGNGNPERVRADAEHVFDASRYGSYFVTTDTRILKKATELNATCDITVLKPSELIEIIESYQTIDQLE